MESEGWQFTIHSVSSCSELVFTPVPLKELYLKKLRFKASDHLMEIAFAYALNRKSKDISFTNVNQGIKKSSVKLDETVNIDEMAYFALSLDMVQLIRLLVARNSI